MQPSLKADLLAELTRMLRDLFEEHERGAAGVDLARAHGYLDGYMQSLMDSGLFERAELLSLVGKERTHVRGRAVEELLPETDEVLREATAA